MGKKLVLLIWKEIKPTKSAYGLIKYNESPIECKYIHNLNQLQQCLYYLYAQEKAGNNNFHIFVVTPCMLSSHSIIIPYTKFIKFTH